MKYVVLIVDGAAGMALAEGGNKTCLELARTPNLDKMASAGFMGLVRTVPPGMEPSSAIACMSVIGYDPREYYEGRAAIEAASMGILIGAGEAVFRCNLVTLSGGKMADYSAGHITSSDSAEIINTLNEKLGSDNITFYPGVGYRHILKIKGHEEAVEAVCAPPHDIPGQTVAEYLPHGNGSDILLKLMENSREVLENHPVNVARQANGELPANSIWLFWGSRQPERPVPPFRRQYGLSAAMTSGVDLLKGLAKMAGMEVLEIKGVTDGSDNDFAGQAAGALDALKKHDLVVVHVEAPDEAAHGGSADEKIEAIEKIDSAMVGKLLDYGRENIRVLVMPDHPTPIARRTHTPDPVPFLIWGSGIEANGVKRFTEKEASKTGVFIEEGYRIMGRLVGKD